MKRILIVDDEPGIISMLKIATTLNVHTHIYYEDAEKEVKKLRKKRLQ